MNPIIQQMVNYKINNISKAELLSYANQNGISLTDEQASKILTILRKQQIDIFDVTQRKHLLAQVERIIGKSTAMKINQLFMSFINRA